MKLEIKYMKLFFRVKLNKYLLSSVESLYFPEDGEKQLSYEEFFCTKCEDSFIVQEECLNHK